jgi:hypothetical protein
VDTECRETVHQSFIFLVLLLLKTAVEVMCKNDFGCSAFGCAVN